MRERVCRVIWHVHSIQSPAGSSNTEPLIDYGAPNAGSKLFSVSDGVGLSAFARQLSKLAMEEGEEYSREHGSRASSRQASREFWHSSRRSSRQSSRHNSFATDVSTVAASEAGESGATSCWSCFCCSKSKKRMEEDARAQRNADAVSEADEQEEHLL